MSFDDELRKVAQKRQSDFQSKQDEEKRKVLETERRHAAATQHVNASLAVAQSFIIPLLRKTNKVAKLKGRLEIYNGDYVVKLDGLMESLGFTNLEKVKTAHNPTVECKLIWSNDEDHNGQHELVIEIYESKFQSVSITDNRFKSVVEKYILEQLSDPSRTYRQSDIQSP